MRYAIRFNSKEMQVLYENLIKDGYHWKMAESKVIQLYTENGYLENK